MDFEGNKQTEFSVDYLAEPKVENCSVLWPLYGAQVFVLRQQT